MPTYRTHCPHCKKPLPIPIWKACSSCMKQIVRERSKTNYKESRDKARKKYRVKQKGFVQPKS